LKCAFSSRRKRQAQQFVKVSLATLVVCIGNALERQQTLLILGGWHTALRRNV
jgi:hypothetical protein